MAYMIPFIANRKIRSRANPGALVAGIIIFLVFGILFFLFFNRTGVFGFNFSIIFWVGGFMIFLAIILAVMMSKPHNKPSIGNVYKKQIDLEKPSVTINPYKTVIAEHNKEDVVEIVNYCRYCGAKKDLKAVFCHMCGTKF